MNSKKTSQPAEVDFESAKDFLQQVTEGLKQRKISEDSMSPEYEKTKKDLIAKAMSVVKSQKLIKETKQQMVDHLRYLGEFRMYNGMPRGKDVVMLDDDVGVFYKGPVIDGVPNTKPGEQGISVELDGSVYIGEWEEGEATGRGTLFDSFENIFVGEFTHGQFEGEGKELLSSGLVLEGDFAVVEFGGQDISQLHGDGKLIFPAEGYSFDGKWKYGKRNGSGIEKYADGFVCVGEWQEDFFHNGIIRYDDGTIEEGDFSHDYELEGDGFRVFPNGVRIKNLDGGIWKDGSLQGEGLVTFAEDMELKEFRGQFKDTAPSGKGILTFKNGTVQEGTMKDGSFTGKVRVYVPGSFEYEGELAPAEMLDDDSSFLKGSLEPQGYGKIVFNNGTIYDGQWAAGVPNGEGELFYPEKFHYIGAFKNGKFHGDGKLVSLDTKYSFEGTFKNGKKHGKGKEVLSNNVVLEGTFEADDAISIKSINFENLLDSFNNSIDDEE